MPILHISKMIENRFVKIDEECQKIARDNNLSQELSLEITQKIFSNFDIRKNAEDNCNQILDILKNNYDEKYVKPFEHMIKEYTSWSYEGAEGEKIAKEYIQYITKLLRVV